MGELSPVQIQHRKAGLSHGYQSLKWGILCAGIYLLVSIPCAGVYLADRHEYSIPLFIIYFASFPTHFVMFQVLRPVTLPLERLPHGETWGLLILLVFTALLYFFIGQCGGWLVRFFKGRLRSSQTESKATTNQGP
jgi:hypothetical protein